MFTNQLMKEGGIKLDTAAVLLLELSRIPSLQLVFPAAKTMNLSRPKRMGAQSSGSSSPEDTTDYELMHNPYRNRRCYETVYDNKLPNSTLALELPELAAQFLNSVPFRVQVATSCMAKVSRGPSIPVDEKYTVHLMREMSVLKARDSADQQLEIPVNSNAKIGLVPQDQVRLYKTVADIVNAKQLPKAVAVRHQYVSADNSFSLKKNEVLLIKEAIRGKFGRSKNSLKVFSLLSHQELILPKDCDANFITDPECTKVYPTDLLDNDIAFIPCSAYLYPNQQRAAMSAITITSLESRESLLVSLFRDCPDYPPQQTQFIDIPITAAISMTVIKTDQSSRIFDRIYEESQYLLTTYSPLQIQYCVQESGIQARLLAEVKEGKAIRELVSSAPKQYHKFLSSTLPVGSSISKALPGASKPTRKSLPVETNTSKFTSSPTTKPHYSRPALTTSKPVITLPSKPSKPATSKPALTPPSKPTLKNPALNALSPKVSLNPDVTCHHLVSPHR